MKTIFAFFLLGYLINAQTPSEQLLENTWYLTEMIVDGETYYPPSNDELGIITMGISSIEDSELYWFHSEVCSESSMGGLVQWVTDSQFSFFDFACCGTDMCTLPENNDFEMMYASFYGIGGFDGIPLDYSILNNSDESLTLVVTSYLGNQVFYSNLQMSVQDNDNLKLNFYPNPVKDKLTIENTGLKITSVTVKDVSGNIVAKQVISAKQTEIDFSNLPKGIYFVSFNENGKVIKTEKVIKK